MSETTPRSQPKKQYYLFIIQFFGDETSNIPVVAATIQEAIAAVNNPEDVSCCNRTSPVTVAY